MESCDTPLKMACWEYSIASNCSGGGVGWSGEERKNEE